MGETLAPGWYRLPSDAPHIIRYWDGTEWSGPHVLAQSGAAAEPTAATAGARSYPTTTAPARDDRSEVYARLSTAPTNGPDVDKAGAIGPRLLARAIDTGVELCLYLILLLPTGSVSIGQRGFWKQFPGMSSAPTLWAIIAAVVAFFAWEWAWVSQRGATPGKQLAGLWVVEQEPADPSLPLATPRATAIRFGYRALFGVPILGFLVWSLEAFLSLWYMREDTRFHRSLPDRIAGTKVVGSLYRPQVTSMPSGRAPLWIIGGAMGFIVLVGLNWQIVQRPVFEAADSVMDDFQDGNLAEATASFAQSCSIDRQRYAEYFSQTQITTYRFDEADVDWAVPFFSREQDRSQALVTGHATAVNEGAASSHAVRLQMVREDGKWRACELLS